MRLERLFSCLKTFIKKDCVFSSAKTYQRRQFNVSFRRFIGFLESVGRFAQKKITISAFFSSVRMETNHFSALSPFFWRQRRRH
jgi:hypothetical protein